MNKHGIIFISCGQRTKDEISLGKRIVSMVEDLTPFSAYFAETVNDLEGLSKSIFSKLNEAVGYIFIMHNRGKVKAGSNEHIRGSVWIEQEVAIAAFLRQIEARKVYSIAFTEQGLTTEGVREYLHLNPIPFTDSDEVINHLATELPKWTNANIYSDGPKLLPMVSYEPLKQKITQDRHDYHLVVKLKNAGAVKVEDFRIDVEMPRDILDSNHNSVLAVHSNSRTHQLFRATNAQYYDRMPIYRTEEKEIVRIPYYITNETYELSELIKVTVYSGDMEPQMFQKMVNEMNNF